MLLDRTINANESAAGKPAALHWLWTSRGSALERIPEQHVSALLDGDIRRHRLCVDRFGRFPHRNDILGRTSTAAELTFLQQPGSSF